MAVRRAAAWRRQGWVLAGSAAAALLLGPAAPVASAGLWSAPATLGQEGSTVAGDVAVDADGTTIVAWAAGGGAVRAVVRPAAAAFGPATTLAPAGGQAAAVAADGHGGSLIAWSAGGSLGLAERTRAQPRLTVVPTAVTGVQDGPDVAFVGPDRAIVVWAGSSGAVHALMHETGGGSVPLADLDPGPGNSDVRLDAAAGHAVAAWTTTQRAAGDITTRVRASVLAPDGSFGAPEDVASATRDESASAGSQMAAGKVAVTPTGSADVLISQVVFQGMPGETALTALVAARPLGAWLAPQPLGFADGLASGGQFDADIGAGPGGGALFAAGAKPNALPAMTFTARERPAGAPSYGDAAGLLTGQPGQVRVAPLAGGRFLVLLRSGSGLRSRAGSAATGFGSPLVFSGTDSSGILALAGAPSGLAAAAWVTTTGAIDAAIYDDSLGPRALPPPAATDTVAPVLSRLSVSPRRFAVRRGTRIRWRLSEPARVTFRVALVRHRFKHGRRLVPRGAFTRTARQGKRTVRFSGRMRGRALRPGRYRLTAIARDASGNRSRSKRTGFTVVSHPYRPGRRAPAR